MRDAVEILLVEDNIGDVELTKEALSRGKINNHLHVVHDGECALQFLRKENEFADVPTPDIVLLDLNLPKLSGHEVLKVVKETPELLTIPIIVLTSSSDHSDIRKTYQLHGNSFVTKPVSINDFLEVVRAIEGFWIEIVKLPTRDAS